VKPAGGVIACALILRQTIFQAIPGIVKLTTSSSGGGGGMAP